MGRRLAQLPLDTATDAGFLVAIHRLPAQHGIDCAAQITARDGLVGSGATVVELAAIDQPAFSIEQVKVRRAGGLVRLRHFLSLVEAEWKAKREAFGHLLEPFWSVIGIMPRIVAADADDTQAGLRIVLSQLCDFCLNVQDIGTVAAEEHHQQGGFSDERIERADLPAHYIP